ncbi:MAG: hypothetical protein GY793_05345 [Proteobacteria bacterium]|nr:hypothetical protein [Pseudomonadota bacterium]
MKYVKYLFIIISIIFVLNANANSSTLPAKFELSYNRSFLELEGDYFKNPVSIGPVDDLFQISNKSPVGAFRNIYSAYLLNDIEWLKNHYIGNVTELKSSVAQYRKITRKQRISLNGYAIFKNYAIMFLQTGKTDKKLIMILEQKDNEYRLCFNFNKRFTKTYTTIFKSYHNLGLFKVIKSK